MPEKLVIRTRVKLGVPKRSTEINPFDGSVSIKKSDGFEIPSSWDEISAIHQTRGISISTQQLEKLVHVVELPLYPATLLLNQAGIETTESNAHFESEKNETTIILGIKWESLKPQQQAMAHKLMKEHPERWVRVSAAEHGDSYEAFYLKWVIKKDEVSPIQVYNFTRSSAERLIKGLIKIV